MKWQWSYLKPLVPVLKNRYVVVALLFITWLLFFDRYNLITQFKLKRQASSLQDEIEYYKQQTVDVKSVNDDLFSDPDKLERFAREEYMMKKPKEDLFVIVDKK